MNLKKLGIYFILSPIFFAAQLAAASGEYPAPPVPVSINAPYVEPIVGLRPFREHGIRLERERIENLIVIHDYGHGGAGLTLSWGTSAEAIRLANQDLSKNKYVIVIGAGVVGLTTALQLSELGYQVKVYSRDFFPNNVSRVAGGLWSPVSVDLTSADVATQKKLHDIQIDSYKKYDSLVGKGWGIQAMPFFITEEAREKSGLDLFVAMPEIFKLVHHDRLPIEGVKQGGYELTTFLIDTPVFMTRLMREVRGRGITLIQKDFKDFAEIEKEVGKDAVVFHSTGLGARELAHDQNMIPVRGDLIYLKKNPSFDPATIGYMAFYGNEGTDYIFPRSGEMVIGGTFRKGIESIEVDPAICAIKLKSLAAFLGK